MCDIIYRIIAIFALLINYNTTNIMESIRNSNSSAGNGQIMTLRSYYKNLPEPTHPKKALINSIAVQCGVTLATARNWILYGIRPDKPEHVRIISGITGIPAENLWND